MPKRKPEVVFLDGIPDFKPGDPRPEGYLEVHAWAEVQLEAGIKQTACPRCKRWHFPQEQHKCDPRDELIRELNDAWERDPDQ